MKKFISIILVAVMMLLALVSCADTHPYPPEDTSGTANTNTIVIFKKGVETDYKVIYADTLKEEKTLVSAAKGVSYQIQQKFKYDYVECSPEYVEFNIVYDREILIGDTTRDESAEAKKLLKGAENEYAIKLFDNGKIAIVASNIESLIKAVNYFTGEFLTNLSGDILEIEKGYSYYADLGATPRPKWNLSLPEYVGGTVAKEVYPIGLDRSLSTNSNAGKMRLIADTNAEQFAAYLTLLESEGYTLQAKTETNGNVYAQYYNSTKNNLGYVYFLNAFGEARIIEDYASIPESEFEYSYTAKEGETTAYYQYGLMQDPYGNGNERNPNDNEVWGNAGALDIIRLADNKLIIIDGGGVDQATKAATDALVDFLFDITNTPVDGQVTVAAWFLTHPHGDHYRHTYNIATDPDYSGKFVFERMMSNIPSGAVMGTGSEFANTASAIIKSNPDVKFIKLHTGQNITLGNIDFDVIMTHEDAVDPKTGKTFIIDGNNASTVLKFNINGKSIMYFGDWGGNDQSLPSKVQEYREMERRFLDVHMTEPNTFPFLKADAVQIAHHAINSWMGRVYTAVDPDYAFFSQADLEFFSYGNNLTHQCYKTIINQLREIGMPDENMYFQGRKTNWIEIAQDGTITHGEKALEGATEGYWYFLDANGNEIKDTDGNLIKVSSIEELDALNISVIVKEIALDSASGHWTLKDEYGKAITGTLEGCSAAESAGAVKAVHFVGYWEYLEGLKPWTTEQ